MRPVWYRGVRLALIVVGVALAMIALSVAVGLWLASYSIPYLRMEQLR